MTGMLFPTRHLPSHVTQINLIYGAEIT